jgi:hypothetical protein
VKYIDRLIAKNGGHQGRPTDKNDRNPGPQSLHATEMGHGESANSPCDPLTKTTKIVSVVSVSNPEGVSAKSSIWYVDRAGRVTRDATAADLIADRGPKPTDPAPKPPWPPRPAELARWPVEWRERWGRLANQLEDQGVPWPDHERRAFDQIKAEMTEAIAS